MRSYSGIFSSCSSILDKEDLSSISEEQVWVDETLTTAFLNALYVSIPSWDTTVADASDEATGGGGWVDGTTTPDNMSDTQDSAPTWYWPYKTFVTVTFSSKMHRIRIFVRSIAIWLTV